MLFVALFHDDRTRLQVKADHMAAHLNYLDREKDRILAAGSLREELDESSSGSLWIIQASTKQEAEDVCHGDPFWAHGIRKWVTVLHWSQAVPVRKEPAKPQSGSSLGVTEDA